MLRRALILIFLGLPLWFSHCLFHPLSRGPVEDLFGLEDDDSDLLRNFLLFYAISIFAPPVYFTNGQAASVVIGQSSFTSSDSGRSETLLGLQYGNPTVIDGRLYLPDNGNYRIMGYNSIPVVNGASADFVIGATDFVSLGNLLSVDSLTNFNGRLFVTYNPPATSGTGVGVFNSAPVSTTASSPDYSLTDAAESNLGISFSQGSLFAGGNRLVVGDYDLNRVLVWNSIPAANGIQPDLVLGQTNFSSSSANAGTGSPNSVGLRNPSNVWTDGNRIVIIDSSNHRVLIWNSWPANSGQPADLVLGQPDFTSANANQGMGSPTASTMQFPYIGIAVNGNQLFIGDGNYRVLIWNTWPTQNGQAADVVLGQPDFTSDVYPEGASATSFYPSGIFLSGTRLIISDNSVNRYLIFEGGN